MTDEEKKEKHRAYMREYMRKYNQTANGKAIKQRRSQKMADFMRTEGLKFNALKFNQHAEKFGKQKRKVGALAEALPFNFKLNGILYK